MALVTTKELFQQAYTGGYAIGGFNVNNMEIVQGIMQAAAKQKSGVILQVSAGARKYANPFYLQHLVEAAIQTNPEVPVALHLDHGADFEICKQCIDSGFSSVMIDGSHHDFDTNIELTKQVVAYAHPRGVVVEAELGTLEGVEDDVVVAAGQGSYTDPSQAREFVERSGCDSLAVAIGTSHGAYKFKEEPKLDFDRLNEITKILEGFPLVLHGASTVIPEFVDMCNAHGGNIPGSKGVPEHMIAQAVKTGVCKVNIDTDIRFAVTGVIRKYLEENPGEFDPRKYLGVARQAVEDMVSHKIDILGSKGSIIV